MENFQKEVLKVDLFIAKFREFIEQPSLVIQTL